jgi:cytochrome c-type biogenesis protein CcmH
MLSGSLTFWLIAAAMVAAALAFVLPRLMRGGSALRGRARDELNAEVYRAELADLERERAANAISATDYERARGELERRLLDDLDVAHAPAGTAVPHRVAGVAVGVALPVLAVALYLGFGTPEAVEQRAGAGASDAAPQAAGGDFRAQLLAHLRDAPRDGRAWVALARLDMDDDRFDDAAKHYAKAVDVSAKIARDPGVLCEYADALGMAQGGRLEGTPVELVTRALALDPAHPKALEMAGSAAYERRDFRTAARHWRALLEQFPSGTPAHAELAAAVERAERLATLTLPPPAVTPRGG